MRIALVVLLSVLLSACSHFPSKETVANSFPAGVELIESHQVGPERVGIGYDKYRLANGLTVILHHDHSDPLVHVDMTYHVGSAREEEGYSGFAHFFEHMMFQGSEHVGDQEHFRLITEAGGTMNGTTNRDRTNYFQTVPANELEKVLWLEADRMGFLLDAVSQHKFEIQRDTVKNERSQRYDNRPYGLMYERMGEALYPRQHPYSWQTIGYVEDLERVDVDDLKAFFLRWYGPNNAVLTIGGDIDANEALRWVNKYFGSIPRGPEVENAPKWPVSLESDRYITLEDRIQQPMLLMAWPTEYRGSDNELSLDILARVLGGGRNSLLYQELVKPGIVLDAGAFQDCAELACTFYVYAMGNSGDSGDLTQIRQQVLEVMSQLSARGISEDDLDEIKGMVEAGMIFGLQSVSGKVSQLASNETFYAQPDRLQTEFEALNNVLTDDVEMAFKRFIQHKPSVSLSTVPLGREDLAAADVNYVPAERMLPEREHQQVDYQRPVDDFDRSIMPVPSTPVEVHLPELYRFSLDNGIDVLGTVNSETPTVQIQLSIPAGRRDESPEQAGLARLTAAMLNEATQTASAEVLAAELDKLGSRINVRSNTYSTTVSITTLTRHLDETLAIAAQKLWQPAFDEADFQRLKQQTLEGLQYERQRAEWLANQATRALLYADTPFAESADGTPASVAGLTLIDVKDFYTNFYTHEGASVVVVGDIAASVIEAKLSKLGQWQGKPMSPRADFALPVYDKAAVWLVDRPNSPQSNIRFVRHAQPFDADGEMFTTQLANFNLAGNFNSRINLNLREDKGYTYGAGGYLVNGREIGYATFYAQVRADATGAAISEVINEMNEVVLAGFTEQEVDFMRMAVGQKEALSYETPSQKAGLLAQMQIYALDKGYIERQNQIVAEVSKETLNQMAKKWFDPRDYQVIVVGDEKTVRPQLELLDIPIYDLHVE
ncbi:M16 family metallopeptidase [Thaumasiovibrio sp. DFM-14]|uniref:M16 family metallopeptidase n=1 Tax=Thaumasiovibrio sp. DFM-14 TaxID=3384792 RepID=UPI0039A06E0E